MARPSKLTNEVAERILGVVRLGNRRVTAAQTAGVGEATLYRWLADPRPRYREFRESVERAEAEAEAAVVAILRNAMPRNARAAMWFLENRSSDWRQRRLAPPPVAPPALDAGPPPEVVVVDRDLLAQYGLEHLHRAPTPQVEAADTRSRLVEDARPTPDISTVRNPSTETGEQAVERLRRQLRLVAPRQMTAIQKAAPEYTWSHRASSTQVRQAGLEVPRRGFGRTSPARRRRLRLLDRRQPPARVGGHEVQDRG